MNERRDFRSCHQIDIALACLDRAAKALRDSGSPDRWSSTALWLARAEMALKRLRPEMQSPADRARYAAACAMLEDAEARQHH